MNITRNLAFDFQAGRNRGDCDTRYAAGGYDHASLQLELAMRISTREQQCYERRHELISAHLGNARRRDLLLLLMSVAVLLMSFAMVCWGVHPPASMRALLFVTWGLFGLVVILALVSLLFSQMATYFRLRSASDFYTRDRLDNGRGTKTIAIVGDLMGLVNSLTFVGAVVCLIVFVALSTTQNEITAANATSVSPPQVHQAQALLPPATETRPMHADE